MDLNKTTADNNVFTYAFMGALLFSAAIGFAISNLSDIAMFEISSIVITCILTITSLSFLYKAIRNDSRKLRGS